MKSELIPNKKLTFHIGQNRLIPNKKSAKTLDDISIKLILSDFHDNDCIQWFMTELYIKLINCCCCRIFITNIHLSHFHDKTVSIRFKINNYL